MQVSINDLTLSVGTTPTVLSHMMEIMSSCIEESDNISFMLLDQILVNLIGTNKKEESYRLAQTLISRTAGRLQPFLTRFIKESLIHGNVADSELGKHAHEIVYEVYLISPALLDLVLPQLEPELGVAEAEPRLRAVQLIGRLAGRPGSTLASKFTHLFQALLSRFTDLEADIRREMVEFAKHFLKNCDGNKADVEELNRQLLKRLNDSDEAVRKDAVGAVCFVIESQPTRVHDELVTELLERTRDRKKEIRKEAQELLAKAFQSLKSKDAGRFRIPQTIISCCLLPDLDDKLRAERLFSSVILNEKASTEDRIKTLAEAVEGFEETEWKAMSSLLREKHQFQQALLKFLQARKDKTSDKDAEVDRLARDLALRLPGGDANREKIKDFYNHKDEKPMTLLVELCSGGATLARTRDLAADIDKRVSALKNPARTELVKRLVRKATFTLVTVDGMPALFAAVLASLDKQEEPASLKFLKLLSSTFPALLSGSFKSLIEFLKHGDDALVRTALEMMSNCAGSLGPEDKNLAKSVQKKLVGLGTTGSLESVKPALQTIAKLYPRSVLESIFEHHLKNLGSKSVEPPSIKAVGCLLKLGVKAKAAQLKTIRETLDKIASSKSGELHLRALAVTSLVALLLPAAAPESIFDPVLEMLSTLLSASAPLLRSRAAKGLLRLARTRFYDKQIPPSIFHKLSNIPQDTSDSVRREFAEKLFQGLKTITGLPVYYLALFAFYGGADQQTQAFVKRQVDLLVANLRRIRPISQALLPENCLPWLIHTIASSPEFGEDAPKYERTLTFLEFMLERLFHQADNYSFVMQMLALIKQCTDANDDSKTRNNRTVCEIGLRIVGQKKDIKGWSVNKEITNQILPNLPGSLYEYDEEERNENLLPPEFEYKKLDNKQRIMSLPTPVKEAQTPAGKKRTGEKPAGSKAKVQKTGKNTKSPKLSESSSEEDSPSPVRKATPKKPATPRAVNLDQSSPLSPPSPKRTPSKQKSPKSQVSPKQKPAKSSPKEKPAKSTKASKPKAATKKASGTERGRQTKLTKDVQISRERSASPARPKSGKSKKKT